MVRELSPMVLLAFAAVALSGCSGATTPPGDAPVLHDGMTILGLVQNETFAPILGAQVSIRLTNHTTTTDAGGLFSFTGLALSPYLVDVVAAGFANATLNAAPRDNVSLSFILFPPADQIQPPVTIHFQGTLQCAFEALIISPSCDTVVDVVRETELPQVPMPVPLPDVFTDISTFEAILNKGWATVVIDLDFDQHPGLDGLRLTLQGRNDADQLGSYQMYGRFHDSDPFTARIEPGQTYEDGTAPVPHNATALQFEVYPHGHGWHALCSDPVPNVLPAGRCPLGVGVAQNVQFDLYVTVFYTVPAPDDFTLLP